MVVMTKPEGAKDSFIFYWTTYHCIDLLPSYSVSLCLGKSRALLPKQRDPTLLS